MLQWGCRVRQDFVSEQYKLISTTETNLYYVIVVVQSLSLLL